MTTPSRAALRAKLDRLREVMPEDEIFMYGPEGGIYFSPKAARRLEQMAWADQGAWRDQHRGQAAEAAADILNRYQGKAA